MIFSFRAALAATVVVYSLTLSAQAHAQAFYLQEQSARAAGRAFSGEVADTGAASLWWNPAAIADTNEREVTISAAAILPRGKVIDQGTLIRRPGQLFAPVGGDGVARNPINKGVLPSGAIALPLTDRIAVGLAVTSPYSFTTNYDENSWSRYSADRTKLRTVDIQPSLGIALTDWLRVGGAVNVEYTDASLSNKLPNLSAALPDGEQRLAGDGWDLGWTAGVQLHHEWATVGIAYKSAIEHHLKGELETSGLAGPLAASNRTVSDARASFYTPAQIIVGGRFRASDALTLNTQVVRYTWSKFDAIRLGAPINTAIPENYRDSWSLAGGVDYAVSPAVTLRAGVQHAITPTRNGDRDARVPDSDRWNYGAGATFKLTSGLSIDAAANYVDFKDATIDRITAAYAGTAVQTPIVTDGSLKNAHAVVLSLGARLTF